MTKIWASTSGETFFHFMLRDGTSTAGGKDGEWLEFDPDQVGRIKLAHYDLQTFVIELYNREGEKMLRAGFDDDGADQHWIELQEGQRIVGYQAYHVNEYSLNNLRFLII